MANVSFNLASGHGRVLDLIPAFYEGEVNLYGPIYFGLQSLLIDTFGLHHIVFRMPNLLAGYASIFLLALVLRNNHVSRQCQLLFILAAIVDVSFNRNLVSGRMDMLAVMFVLIALYFTNRGSPAASLRALPDWLAIGSASALAYLTTPRALFLLPMVAILAFDRFYRDSETEDLRLGLAKLGVAALGFLVPVLLWIEHVGGLHAYATMLTASDTTQQHIGTSFFRSVYDNVAIAIMLALAVFRWKHVARSPLLIGLLSTYVAFSLFVKEVGPTRE